MPGLHNSSSGDPHRSPVRVHRTPVHVQRDPQNVSHVVRLSVQQVLPPPPPPPVVESQVLERDGFDLNNQHQRDMSERFNRMKPGIQDYFDRLWSALETE